MIVASETEIDDDELEEVIAVIKLSEETEHQYIS